VRLRSGFADRELDADGIAGGSFEGFARALAEIGEGAMRLRAELKAGGNEDAVHLHAGGAQELEFDGRGIARVEAARKDTAAAGHDRAGQEAHGARRVVKTKSGEAHVPTFLRPALLEDFAHTGFIGRSAQGHEYRMSSGHAKGLLLCYCGVMLVGTGIDAVEVPRIARSIERYGERFLQRIFTDDEIAYCRARAGAAESFAARFAAKEAGAKALGTGIQYGVNWKEREFRRLPGQRPTLHLSGRARAIAGQLGVQRVSLSLTHTSSLALATVHLED
jgi:holo-[acyl-carrier protein] synthase